MTYKQISTMISSMGYPTAYYQFEANPDNPPPAPPFICFYYPNADDLKADNINYARINALIIELYTDNKDFEAEAAIESVLVSNEIPFDKTETFIESEKMFQITYTMEVVING